VRNKTEADHEEMARLEWEGSLYLDKNGRIGVPGQNLRACIVGPGGGARQSKRGKDAAKALRFPRFYLLDYDGPEDYKELWKIPEFRHRAKVNVQRSSVIRTRPIFEEWSIIGELCYNTDFADLGDIVHWLKVSGHEVGLGDWRPAKYGPYGTFDVEIL